MKKHTFRGDHSGFTLIEMVVVIAVIAVLATIVITGVQGFRSSARDAKRVADIAAVRTNLELFFAKCAIYPVANSTGTLCGSTVATSGTVVWATVKTAVDTMTGSVLPTDSGYAYAWTNTGLGYILKAQLESKNGAVMDAATELDGTQAGLACDDASPTFGYCVSGN